MRNCDDSPPIALHMGARVRERRRTSNLTQEAVAKAIGMSAAELAAAEGGDRMLTPADIVELCPVLRVHPSWFFQGLF